MQMTCKSYANLRVTWYSVNTLRLIRPRRCRMQMNDVSTTTTLNQPNHSASHCNSMSFESYANHMQIICKSYANQQHFSPFFTIFSTNFITRIKWCHFLNFDMQIICKWGRFFRIFKDSKGFSGIFSTNPITRIKLWQFSN